MTDECKNLEKKAKGTEKENPNEAIVLYKQASECFDEKGNPKNKNSNLEKAAKLLRGLGKSTEDPTIALDHYEESSLIYTEIGKEGDSEKVMQEAYQKFIDAAKSISAEARKMDIPDVAEQQFKLAAGYATLGMDEKLSNKCWTECADQFYKEAKTLVNPREAFEIFKHAIKNYNKGKAEGKIELLLTDAAEKFNKKGSEIYKTKKTLVLAIGNFLQAENIYRFINSEQKSQESDQKIQEICERIGMVKDSIIQYLETQGITAVSFSDLHPPSHQPDKEELIVPESDDEPLVTEITEDQEPIPSIPKAIPQFKEKDESGISIPEISQPVPKLAPVDVEVEIEAEPVVETPIDEIETVETSQIPPTAEVISEAEESLDPRPIKHGIPGPTVKSDVDEPENDLLIEAPTEMPVDDLDKPKIDELLTILDPEVVDDDQERLEPDVIEPEISESLSETALGDLKEEVESEPIAETRIVDMDDPEIEQPPEISPQEVVTHIEEKYEPEVIKEEITKSPPTFDSLEVEVKIESKPVTEEFDKSEIEHAEIESTSEIDDYMKSRFDPDAAEENNVVAKRSSDTDVAQETGSTTTLSEPIMRILRDQGYLNEDTTKAELLQVPEYQILLFIKNNHPVPLEEIEEKTEVSSISLVLSNLQADGLIEQTNDYQWTVSTKVK